MSHKYNLIHHIQRIAEPELSGLYVKNFFNCSKRYRLILPEVMTRNNIKFCGSCGCIRVPGYNLIMDLIREKEGETEIRTLRYLCKHCEHEEKIMVDKTTLASTSSEQNSPKFIATWKKPSTNEVTKVNKNTNAKERAKKRKQSTLSNLLAAKKEKEDNKNKMSLSLMDFMK